MYKEKIVNIQTGEETWRDYTPEEIAIVEAEIEFMRQKQEEFEANLAARKAVFDKLGLTEEEARLILG